MEPLEGIVCRKCWCQIEVFHNFYTRIENIHRHEETVFVDTLISIKSEHETTNNKSNKEFGEDFEDEEIEVDFQNDHNDLEEANLGFIGASTYTNG